MGTSCIPQREHCWELLVPTPWLCARAGAPRTHHGPAHILSPCSVSELDWLQPRCPHALESCVVFVCASWFSFGALRWVWPCKCYTVCGWKWPVPGAGGNCMCCREKLLRLNLKLGFIVSAVFPGKVFWNRILLLERKPYPYFQPNHANVPLPTYVRTERQWLLFALLASSS